MTDTDLTTVALRYLDAGWHPIPLPAGAKAPPPEGRTGGGGVDLDRSGVEAEAWDGNIGLRMPPDVVGIDVDAYRGGQTTLLDLVARCGPLPPTWISHSSRNDGSGIRFYRVPPGLQWVAGVAGIDMIRWNHRYAVVWPSVHPDGRAYKFADQAEGRFVDDGSVPVVEMLPELPWAWIAELSRGRAMDLERAPLAVSEPEMRAFIDSHVAATHASYTGVILAHFTERWRDGHSRHDTMQHCLTWAAETARAGMASAGPTFDLLADLWVEAVAPDARRAEVWSSTRTTEFTAMLRHAVGRVMAKSDSEMERVHLNMVGARMVPGRLIDVDQGDPASPEVDTLRVASDIDVSPAPQLVRGWFPRSEVCIVAGKPGAGKGIVLADIMARGSRGENMPNGDRLLRTFRSGIVCLPGEDDPREWVRRLTVAKAVLDQVVLIERLVGEDGRSRPVNGATVGIAVEKLARQGCELIVIDSLTGLSNSFGSDTNKSEVRGVMDGLSQVARVHDVTIVLIHHTRKAQGDPLDTLQGNTQIGAASRSVLVVVEEQVPEGAEPEVRLFGVAKLNGSKRSLPCGFRIVGADLKHPDGASMRDDRGDVAWIPKVDWVKDRTFSQAELIAASNGTVLRENKADRVAADILADGPIPSTDFTAAMSAAGFTPDRARRARERVAAAARHAGRWWTYAAETDTAEAKRAIVKLASELDDLTEGEA